MLEGGKIENNGIQAGKSWLPWCGRSLDVRNQICLRNPAHCLGHPLTFQPPNTILSIGNHIIYCIRFIFRLAAVPEPLFPETVFARHADIGAIPAEAAGRCRIWLPAQPVGQLPGKGRYLAVLLPKPPGKRMVAARPCRFLCRPH